MSTLAERFAAGYAVAESGCWEWKRSLNSRGYGLISEKGVVMLAHRVGYELLVGPIAEGMTVDHLCRNKRCVNPGHFEIVTRSENSRRGTPGNKSHCLRGHAMTPENTIIKPRPNGRVIRNCRTCQRDQARERYVRDHVIGRAS